MKLLFLALGICMAMVSAHAQQTQPSGAIQLLARCTQESATLIDQLGAAQTEIASLKADLAKAKAPADKAN